ncbi:hypothetical protein AVEN_82721-2-1, partial [Araneus ventricosus]
DVLLLDRRAKLHEVSILSTRGGLEEGGGLITAGESSKSSDIKFRGVKRQNSFEKTKCACSGFESKDSDFDSNHHAADVRRAYLGIIVNQLVAT